MTKIFTNDNFEEEVIKKSNEMPVLVDFYADWCGSCKMMMPVIDQIAIEYENKALVGIINSEEAPMLAEKYDIMSLPNFFIFKNGEMVENILGAQPKEALSEALNKYL